MSFLPPEELEYRRALMKAAANGDKTAQLKLRVEYHVVVYGPGHRDNPDGRQPTAQEQNSPE